MPQRRTTGFLITSAFGAFIAATAPAQTPAELPQVKSYNSVAAKADSALPPGTILQKNETPIDLASALRLAGAQNPDLLLARERVTEAVAVKQLAAAQLLPNINIGFNYNLHRGVLQQSTGNILTVNRDALNIGLGTSAVGAGTVNLPGLNYNLNIGTAWFDILQTRQFVAGRAAVAKAVENDTLLRVCLAYIDLLRADGRRAIAAQNRDEAAEIARLTAAYAKAGQGRQADADRASVELHRRDVDTTQAEADTLAASARLSQLLNLDPSVRLKPIDGWVVPTPLVPDPVPLSELVAIAMMQRPELAARQAEIRGSIYALSSAKILPFSPNVILGFSNDAFGGGSNLTTPRFGDLGGRTDLDVVVFWQFRNLGLGNIAMVNAAESRVRQSKFRELETLNKVRAEVAEAHARVSARFIQIDSTEKALRSSTDAYSEDLTRIKGGQGLPLEVVDSLRLLARSRYEYLDTIVDYNRAQFQLFVALGRPPADSLARPIPADLVPAPVGPRVRVVQPAGAMLRAVRAGS